MTGEDIYENILLNILALDKGFDDYEFYHCFLGNKEVLKKASDISFVSSYNYLKNTLKNIDRLGIEDSFPRYRRTYIKDFLKCVLIQADFFVFKNKRTFPDLIGNLTGAKPIKPFNAETEFEKVSKEVFRLTGFNNIKKMRAEAKKEKLKEFKHVKKFIEEVFEQKKQALKEYQTLFAQVNINDILPKMRVKIVNRSVNGAPCFFKYNGNYCGTIGIGNTENVSKEYLRGFVMHEGIPGHFLYYCIKQYLTDVKTCDAVALIDTFYSPENYINEGLAVCSDLMFGTMLSNMEKAGVEIEILIHKLFYNLWYSANIKKINTNTEYTILKEQAALRSPLDKLIKYFVCDEKYYTPYYPLGIYYAKKLLPRIKKENFGLLYFQHSINTLKKLTEALKCNKKA
jgi:hypothetical protein